MKQEKFRKDAVQIFQSCTFNRSVTSPPGSTCEHHERADATIVLEAFLQMTKSFWKEEILALRPV
jgi:hypothetical protein